MGHLKAFLVRHELGGARSFHNWVD